MRKPYRRSLFPLFCLAALCIGMLGISCVLTQGQTQAASPQKAALLPCGTWSVVKSPNVGQLSGVAAVSASNIWAVGSYYAGSVKAGQTLIEHWNGTSWSVVKSPNVGSNGNQLSGVVRVPGSSNIWAVGSYAGDGKTLIEYYC